MWELPVLVKKPSPRFVTVGSVGTSEALVLVVGFRFLLGPSLCNLRSTTSVNLKWEYSPLPKKTQRSIEFQPLLNFLRFDTVDFMET